MLPILTAILVLGVIGLILGIVLYVVARKFAVDTDPRVEQIIEILPGANCGGCGLPGCAAFAEACVKRDSMEGLNCPASSSGVMQQIAAITGRAVQESTPKVAVVRCNGSCENRPRVNNYDGASRCVIAAMQTGGETGCFYGCLGCGDCVTVCKFDAIHMNPETGLPEVDQEKCTACGVCVKACPRGIIELRNKNKLDRRIYVSCVNKDKGPVAKKACAVACIGCGKCVKVCSFDAITLENNLAYIDFEKCRLCRKCIDECPQNSIWAVNFPPKRVVTPAAETTLEPVKESVEQDKQDN
ncbi:MAG TPA: Fe-S cluster domain-containing protein [Bacteroidaceae bacterium]|jgi:Na+-translocating ferredoxin:NAD+ oxidoreductase RNF subunit RnfB|nr:Fe-S cluster domain-containing protein [Bacteroidales bacterium]HPX99649.1 Fe-S cluster domain-containing protein [Bacteroidaceae bacterium]